MATENAQKRGGQEAGSASERSWNGVSNGLLFGHPGQLGWQAVAAVAAPVYAFAATFVILKLIGLMMPLRVTELEEALGMDVIQHGEEAYTDGEGALLVVDHHEPASAEPADEQEAAAAR